MAKKWSQEEIDFILENWGSMPVKNIASKLNRTQNAVKTMANKLGLCSQIKCTDMLTVPDLANAINIDAKTIYFYIKNLGLPCIKKKFTDKKTVTFICIDDFWKWAYINKSKLDFSRIEHNILGCEPDWVKEERLRDMKHNCKNIGGRARKWTQEETQLLISLVSKYSYTYDEIANRLGRTVNSIDTRLRLLGIKQRPMKSSYSSQKWTIEEENKLLELCSQGFNIIEISKILNKSQRGVFSKLTRLKKKSG